MSGTDPSILWGLLPNGAGYAVIENHAAPLVGSVALIHAGSGAEDWATQGASHFLEHLVFNGTERRTQEQIDQEIDLLGAYNNATTRATHVAYLLACPRDDFWKALDIQADMLFRSTLPAEKIEKERGIILEELGRSRDDQSYEIDRLLTLDLFGTQGYGLPTVGTESSISSLTREQILSFYKRFYVPSRSTWVVVGDVDPNAAVDSLKAHLGGIPPGQGSPPPPPVFDRSAPLLRIHRAAVDGAVVAWSWIGPDPASAEYNRFAAAFDARTNGDASPLGQALLTRRPGGIEEYSASLSEYPGFSIASIRVNLGEPGEAAGLLEAFPGILEAVRRRPLDPARVEAWKVSAETGEQYLREKPHYYGIIRGEMIAARGLAGLAGYLPGIRAVTPEAVAALPPPLPWPPDRISLILPPDKPAGANAAGARTYREWDLPNGARVAALISPESPVLAVHLFVRDRSKREPAGRSGLAELLHSLLGHATEGRSPEAVSLALDRIGAELKTCDDPSIPMDDFYTVPEYGFVRFQTLDRFAAPGLELLADVIGRPAFSESAFEKARSAAVKRAARSEGSSRATAARRLQAWLHPEAGGGVFGTTESLAPVTLSELRAFAGRYLDPRAFLFVIVSSLPEDSLRALTAATLGRIPAPSGEPPVAPLPPPRGADERDDDRAALLRDLPPEAVLRDRARALFREQPAEPARSLVSAAWASRLAQGDTVAVVADSVGSAQSTVQFARVFSAPEEAVPALILANGILSDRLSRQLREREGLAYSIGSNLTEAAPGTWVWTAAAGTSPAKCERIIEGFRGARQDLLDHPPDALEVRKTAARIYGRGLMRRATRINWAYYAGASILGGQDPRRIEARQRALYEVKPEQVVAAAREYFGRSPGVLIVAR